MAENGRESREYSLKEREYRGEDGQIHHHTNAYMQRQEEEGGRERSGESSSGRGSKSESSSRESGSKGESSSRGGTSRQSAGRSRGESGSEREGQSRGGSRSRGESGSRSQSKPRGEGGSRGRSGSQGEEEGSGRDTGYTALVTAVAVGITAITAAALMSAFRARRSEEVVVYDVEPGQAGHTGRDDSSRGSAY
jgi:hypothetical protein